MLKDLSLKLHSLTIFRNLLTDPVIENLSAFLDSTEKEDIKASDFGGNAIVIVDLVANDLMNDYRILVERSRLLSETESALDVIMELAE